MKTTYLKIYFLALLFLFFKDKTMAQQGKSDLVFSGTLAHYIRSGIESGNQGFYVYPVDPGLEVLPIPIQTWQRILYQFRVKLSNGKDCHFKRGNKKVSFWGN